MHDPVQILVHLTWIKVQVYILRGIFVWNDANNTPKTEGNTGFWQGVIFFLFFLTDPIISQIVFMTS